MKVVFLLVMLILQPGRLASFLGSGGSQPDVRFWILLDVSL